MKFYFTLSLILITNFCLGQTPQPCGPIPEMTSFCSEACVICDIDGYTGVNDLTAQGQGFDEFCTSQWNNMQYISFIAGSVDLTIQVDVSNCIGGIGSLEVGFFQTEDCQTFIPITDCDTDIQSGENQVFSNEFPLTIGQHYYLVIDGSAGANCNWTFSVLEGTTEVLPLSTSGVMSFPRVSCPGNSITFSTTGEVGAALFFWTIDGMFQPDIDQEVEFVFEDPGKYEICVTAANVCDEAPPTCDSILIREVGNTILEEILCDGTCIEVNGTDYCDSGSFQESIEVLPGCDSIINIFIEVLPQAEAMIDVWICNDQSFSVGDNTYTDTGNYLDTILTTMDCDSLVFLDLLAIECEISGTASSIPVICHGTSTGTLIFSVDQGTPPLTFVYTNIEDGSINGTGTTNLLTNNEIPGIPVGIYQIYIEDNFGNDFVVLQPVTEPSPMEIELIPSEVGEFNLSCNSSYGMVGSDGFLIAECLGGVPPYSYEWSDGQTQMMAENLTAQEYSVTVTDSSGCPLISSFILTAPPSINPDVAFNDPTCEGFETGEIFLSSIEGGTAPYLYSLSAEGFGSDTLFENLLEGDYTFFIQDANGCVDSVSSTLVAPDIPVVSFAEDVTIFLGNDTILYPILNDTDLTQIGWTEVEFLDCGDCLEPTAMPVNTTEFQVEVTSVSGCIAFANITVEVIKRRRVYVPNIFTPESFDVNNRLTVFGGPEVRSINDFSVYDRWGNLMYNAENFAPNDLDVGWDGWFRGQRVNPSVFTWIGEIEYIDDFVETKVGSITLMR